MFSEVFAVDSIIIHETWCGRRDLNPHGLPQEPETCASANFATSAFSRF